MARKKQNKKVLLIEPNYKNKFPPIGLMKLATYYRNLGNWEVVFYKGDLNDFVIERIVDKLINNLNDVDTTGTDWQIYKDILLKFVKTRKQSLLDELPINNSEVGEFLYLPLILDAKDYYWKKIWEQEPEWDRVGVTTLFTFYWDITVETINFAKKLVKDKKDLMVGGVLASLQPKELEAATGITPYVGILNKPGILDQGDTQIIDELELDYSILDEIEYRYPMSDAYYRYMTKGCIRKCAFCAVKTLEPVFNPYISLTDKVNRVNELYGPQRDLLLMDNNVLASPEYESIIQEIIDSGFAKDAKYLTPNQLDIAVRNLRNGVNDRAYVRRTWHLIDELYQKLKGEESYQVYRLLEKYHLQSLSSARKDNLLAAYDELKEINDRHYHPVYRKRIVDFNQGLDARLFTQEKANLLGKIAISPVRIAFDDMKTKAQYIAAIRMCVNAGITNFSNYLLYNFKDNPNDLYERLRINIELCEELNVNIYSFPMKYHPLWKTEDMKEDYSHNRDFIGNEWNRKYIRVIQAILNSTKGKVGKGRDFFYKAFGHNIEEYHMLLEMPETFIIYRFFFEWMDTPEARKIAINLFGDDSICNLSTPQWEKLYKECKSELSEQEWISINDYIHKNEFQSTPIEINNEKALRLLNYYLNYRGAILDTDSRLSRMKAEYDKNPAMELKWN